jgi:hypothetical protein
MRERVHCRRCEGAPLLNTSVVLDVAEDAAERSSDIPLLVVEMIWHAHLRDVRYRRAVLALAKVRGAGDTVALLGVEERSGTSYLYTDGPLTKDTPSL